MLWVGVVLRGHSYVCTAGISWHDITYPIDTTSHRMLSTDIVWSYSHNMYIYINNYLVVPILGMYELLPVHCLAAGSARGVGRYGCSHKRRGPMPCRDGVVRVRGTTTSALLGIPMAAIALPSLDITIRLCDYVRWEY